MSTKEKTYIKALLSGATEDAARLVAGYSSKPPGRVHKAYETCLKLSKESAKMRDHLEAHYVKRIDQMSKDLKEMRLLLTCIGILASLEDSTSED